MSQPIRAARTAFLLCSAVLLAACEPAPDTLGVQGASLARCPDEACVHTGRRHPDGTRGMFGDTRRPRAERLEIIARVVGDLPGAKIVRQEGDYLHARFRRGLSIDDLEVLVAPDQEVIVRSAARRPPDDGANVARVEQLRAALQEAGAIR